MKFICRSRDLRLLARGIWPFLALGLSFLILPSAIIEILGIAQSIIPEFQFLGHGRCWPFVCHFPQMRPQLPEWMSPAGSIVPQNQIPFPSMPHFSGNCFLCRGDPSPTPVPPFPERGLSVAFLHWSAAAKGPWTSRWVPRSSPLSAWSVAKGRGNPLPQPRYFLLIAGTNGQKLLSSRCIIPSLPHSLGGQHLTQGAHCSVRHWYKEIQFCRENNRVPTYKFVWWRSRVRAKSNHPTMARSIKRWETKSLIVEEEEAEAAAI